MDGKTDEVRRILSEGRADINWRDGYGETALHEAANHGHRDTVRALLEAGADATIGNNDGSTPLMWMFTNGLEDLAVPLVEAGADVNQVNNIGLTALMRAVFHYRADSVQALIAVGADVDLVDRRGRTALSRAENRAIADLLLPHCSEATVAHAADTGNHQDAPREWLAGTHRIQQARRELERVLYDEAAPEMPREIASLCGEFVHRGRLAAVERGAE